MHGQTDGQTPHDGIGHAYAKHRAAIKKVTACIATKYYAATYVLRCVLFVKACLRKDDRP